jgi:plastocyanin
MNKATVIAIGVVLAIGFGLVVAWLLIAANTSANLTSSDVSAPAPEGSAAEQVPLDPNATANPADSNTANVLIENSSFIPAKITVKKGTVVTWTNNDAVGQNVVSDDNAPQGGPPRTANVLKQGEVFSFTFDTVGMFPYHSSPNAFMQGEVEVVE